MFLAVEEFHARVGRAHGDVKLDNFLYCRHTNTVRLIDYQPGAYTNHFRSIEHHETYKSTPAGDFESLGYAVLHSLIGEQFIFKETNALLIRAFKKRFIASKTNSPEVAAVQKYLLIATQETEDPALKRDQLLACLQTINSPL